MVRATEGAEGEASPLQFGIFDWIDNSGGDVADIYEQRLQMLRLADQSGFFCYHPAEPRALAGHISFVRHSAHQAHSPGPARLPGAALSPHPACRGDLHARPA